MPKDKRGGKKALSLTVSMQFFGNEYKGINLPEPEYKQLMAEINTEYDGAYKNKKTFLHKTYSEYRKGYYEYSVRNLGFDNYVIYARRRLKDGKKPKKT